MRAVAVILSGLALLLPPMSAFAAPTQAVLDAVGKVCRPASEKSIAVRDLAEPAGWTREEAPPAAVLAQFPVTQLGSASYVKRFPDGDLHVVSTVIVPPATPFSCIVAIEGTSPEFVSALQAQVLGEKSGYTAMESDPRLASVVQTVTLNRASSARNDGVDKIMAIRRVAGQEGKLNAFVLAYRVDTASAKAGEGVRELCEEGKAPPQLCGGK